MTAISPNAVICGGKCLENDKTWGLQSSSHMRIRAVLAMLFWGCSDCSDVGAVLHFTATCVSRNGSSEGPAVL
jgi:hypothetical protein